MNAALHSGLFLVFLPKRSSWIVSWVNEWGHRIQVVSLLENKLPSIDVRVSLTLTVIIDLDLQSLVSCGHDPHTCKRSKSRSMSNVTRFKVRVETNGRTDRSPGMERLEPISLHSLLTRSVKIMRFSTFVFTSTNRYKIASSVEQAI